MANWQWPDLSRVRKLRKASGLTQKQLADLSGVQQSVISRIEDGKILDPSFSVVRKLFQTLLSHTSDRHQPKFRARDIMNSNVISVKPHQTANEAWHLMKTHDFSQLPVLDGHGRIQGGITLQSLPDIAEEGGAALAQTMVASFIGDPFPIVGQDTSIETLAALLQLNPAVLVMQAGKIVGIITKYDLLDRLYP
jgi:predicted transcriptional regulator